ncbi:MAG: hypothetical protein L6Q92_12085 [Phycisphaerae bacterium]|nr:hypothetical protein [Phycisphaerae bacterium]
MPSVFLLQLAAGCMAMIALSRVQDIAWRYVRLMAIVSLALLIGGVGLIWLNRAATPPTMGIGAASMVALAAAIIWLAINAAQAPTAGAAQRVAAAIAGAAAILAATQLAGRADPLVANAAARQAGPQTSIALLGTVALGALLLGAVTAAMLLGHRYLTETGMTISPLRRLAKVLLIVIAVRGAWVAVALRPVFSTSPTIATDPMWFWLTLSIRVAVGILGAGVFALMIWDCVRRRSTQSATGILYLSMIFVFLGELSGQYLFRTAGLAI